MRALAVSVVAAGVVVAWAVSRGSVVSSPKVGLPVVWLTKAVTVSVPICVAVKRQVEIPVSEFDGSQVPWKVPDELGPDVEMIRTCVDPPTASPLAFVSFAENVCPGF